jgi:cellulose synthase/poly-beta-1,6-N-acetylglucosamine synthase-like glycosyltransferase
VVAHREGERILRRVEELTRRLDAAKVNGQIIVVLDGIADRPNELSQAILETVDDDRVSIVMLPCNCGKALALSEGAQRAEHEILIFADVRQQWNDDTLRQLLGGFRDPAVGAVSGDLVLLGTSGDTEGVRLYWKYEKWLRKQESRLHSVIGVTGAVCAVRRELFSAVPEGTILDDLYWPLKVVMRGYRIQHVARAMAFDRLPSNCRDERRRKTRTLCGNYQLLIRLPSALLPWKNPVWWQFVSHKLFRLAVPWALLGAVISSATINAAPYQWFFIGQVAAYGLIALGMLTGVAYRYRVSSAAAAFVMLNYAAWLAFWVWLLRHERKSWVAIDYDSQE